jgi:ribosomal protein S18 acetylase RimI-like enzyme
MSTDPWSQLRRSGPTFATLLSLLLPYSPFARAATVAPATTCGVGALVPFQFEILDLSHQPWENKNRFAAEAIRLAIKLHDGAAARGEQSIFPIDPSWLREVISADDNGLNRVSVDPLGQLIGFAFSIYHGDKGYIHLEKFGVSEEIQTNGLGRELMHALAIRAEEMGVRKIRVHVRNQNHKAISIYEHWGFVRLPPSEMPEDLRTVGFPYEVPTQVLVKTTGPD